MCSNKGQNSHHVFILVHCSFQKLASAHALLLVYFVLLVLPQPQSLPNILSSFRALEHVLQQKELDETAVNQTHFQGKRLYVNGLFEVDLRLGSKRGGW